MIIAVQDVFLQLAIMGTPYVAGKPLLSLPMAAPGLVSRHRTLALGSVRVEDSLDNRAETDREISN